MSENSSGGSGRSDVEQALSLVCEAKMVLGETYELELPDELDEKIVEALGNLEDSKGIANHHKEAAHASN